MNTYRQKPVDIQATRYDADLDLDRAEKWVRQHGVGIMRHLDTLGQPYFTIGLAEGVLEWRFGAWLVKHPASPWGEFSVFSHDAFLAGHEVALSEDTSWPAATDIGVPAVRFADGGWSAP